MNLLVEKETGYIINPETLIRGENLNILDMYKDTEGKRYVPDHLFVLEINDLATDPDRKYYDRHYYYLDGAIVCKYVLNTYSLNMDIDRLKAELSQSDYKIIKSYEASLLDIGQEYDLNEVYASRQAIRDRINELENYIK